MAYSFEKSYRHFNDHVANALQTHGFVEQSRNKKSAVYMKHDPKTNTIYVAKHHFGNVVPNYEGGGRPSELHISSTNGISKHISHNGIGMINPNTNENDSNYARDTIHKFVKDQLNKTKKGWEHLNEETMSNNPDFDLLSHHEERIKNMLNSHHSYSEKGGFNRAMNESCEIDGEFDSLDETVDLEEADATSRENLLKYQSPARKKWVQDQLAKQKAKLAEAEQIDELSRNTLSSYKKKAWQSLTKPTGVDKAAKRLDSIEKAIKKLGEETLEEGRGRPRKDGTKNEGDDREHIIMQLRKHISLRGAKPIKFADGTSHKISEGHARAALVLHQNLKSSIEKGNFEKKLDASHESFQAAIKSPETAGHETPKHGITLPALDRLKRMKFASGE